MRCGSIYPLIAARSSPNSKNTVISQKYATPELHDCSWNERTSERIVTCLRAATVQAKVASTHARLKWNTELHDLWLHFDFLRSFLRCLASISGVQ